MPGDVGLVAGLIHRLVEFFVNEDELPEIRKRRQVRALHAEANRAFKAGDRVRHRQLLDELLRLSDAP